MLHPDELLPLDFELLHAGLAGMQPAGFTLLLGTWADCAARLRAAYAFAFPVAYYLEVGDSSIILTFQVSSLAPERVAE